MALCVHGTGTRTRPYVYPSFHARRIDRWERATNVRTNNGRRTNNLGLAERDTMITHRTLRDLLRAPIALSLIASIAVAAGCGGSQTNPIGHAGNGGGAGQG